MIACLSRAEVRKWKFGVFLLYFWCLFGVPRFGAKLWVQIGASQETIDSDWGSSDLISLNSMDQNYYSKLDIKIENIEFGRSVKLQYCIKIINLILRVTFWIIKNWHLRWLSKDVLILRINLILWWFTWLYLKIERMMSLAYRVKLSWNTFWKIAIVKLVHEFSCVSISDWVVQTGTSIIVRVSAVQVVLWRAGEKWKLCNIFFLKNYVTLFGVLIGQNINQSELQIDIAYA